MFNRIIVLGFAMASITVSQPSFADGRYVKNQLIVRFKSKEHADSAISKFDRNLFRVNGTPILDGLNLYSIQINTRSNVNEALAQMRRNPNVLYAQLDHLTTRRSLPMDGMIPNDPLFPKQWSLENGTGPSIHALEAWKLVSRKRSRAKMDTVIAVVDGGVDITHNDLVPNIWKNPGEIPGNNIDDDGNGYVDDVFGWNAYNSTGEIPAEFHGTHVAGIAGARGNNGRDVTGINWSTQILSVAASSGTTSVIARGYGYVIAQKRLWLESKGKKGANIVVTNSSFGVDKANCASGDFPVWNDLYNTMGSLGILSAAATANPEWDIDVEGDVPTGCDSPFIISVANTDIKDTLQSAWGKKNVDFAAPGTDILSTVPGNQVQPLSGTSMATPHVTGSVAFLYRVGSPMFDQLVLDDPAKAALVVKTALMNTTDPVPDLKGKVVTDGRLNLEKAAKAIALFNGTRRR